MARSRQTKRKSAAEPKKKQQITRGGVNGGRGKAQKAQSRSGPGVLKKIFERAGVKIAVPPWAKGSLPSVSSTRGQLHRTLEHMVLGGSVHLSNVVHATGGSYAAMKQITQFGKKAKYRMYMLVEALVLAAFKNAQDLQRNTITAKDVTDSCSAADCELLFTRMLPLPLSPADEAAAADEAVAADEAAAAADAAATDKAVASDKAAAAAEADTIALDERRAADGVDCSFGGGGISLQDNGVDLLDKSEFTPTLYRLDLIGLLQQQEPSEDPKILEEPATKRVKWKKADKARRELSKRNAAQLDADAQFLLRNAIYRDLYIYFHSFQTGSPEPPLSELVTQHAAKVRDQDKKAAHLFFVDKAGDESERIFRTLMKRKQKHQGDFRRFGHFSSIPWKKLKKFSNFLRRKFKKDPAARDPVVAEKVWKKYCNLQKQKPFGAHD